MFFAGHPAFFNKFIQLVTVLKKDKMSHNLFNYF
jgi:hypothetical protein